MAAHSRAAACDLDHGMFPPLQTLVAEGVREARRSQDVRGFLLPESGKPTLSRTAATASLTFSRAEAIDDATQQGRRHSTAEPSSRSAADRQRSRLHRACRVDREGTGSARTGNFSAASDTWRPPIS